MENTFLDLKLKVKGLGIHDIFPAEKLRIETREDLIKLILRSKECFVEPAHHSDLVEIAKRNKIKNCTILTKYELKKEIGIASEDDKPKSKSYIFTCSNNRFEFDSRKEAMEGMNLSSKKLANAIKIWKNHDQ